MSSNIGLRIKELREKHQISVDELARRIGKSRATVYRYENNEIENLPYTILVPIANALHTTPTYLLGCEEELQGDGLGKQLTSIREASNLSREEMAKEFNISIEDLKAYEDGIKRIPFELLQRIADYFHVDLNANALFQYRKENNQSNLQTSLNIIKATKRWNEEVGEAQFTDDEVTELINFAKYLISKRTAK